MERLAPKSQMMEETDSLGISALSLEGAMGAALRGEGWGGMEMLILAVWGEFLKRTCGWVQGGHFIRPVGAFGDSSWPEMLSVGLL